MQLVTRGCTIGREASCRRRRTRPRWSLSLSALWLTNGPQKSNTRLHPSPLYRSDRYTKKKTHKACAQKATHTGGCASPQVRSTEFAAIKEATTIIKKNRCKDKKRFKLLVKQSIGHDWFYSWHGSGGSRLLQLLHCKISPTHTKPPYHIPHTHTHTKPTPPTTTHDPLHPPPTAIASFCSPFKPATEATHSDQYSAGGAGSAKL